MMIKKNFKLYFFYLLLCSIYIINIIVFFIHINSEDYLFLEDVNRFSFWNYSFHEGIASIVMFLLPVIICFISILDFSVKIKGNYFKNFLLRDEYENYLKKEFIFAYIKSIVPFILISLLIFILGSLLFKSSITVQYADLYSGFTYIKIHSPYYYVWFSMLLLSIFLALIVNIGLIIFRIIRKYSITVVLTFIVLNILNYIMSVLFNVATFFFPDLTEVFVNFNIYNGYLGKYYINFNFCIICILFIISLILVNILYKDKEKAVMDFE